MPWFKVDDTVHSHPKARAAGLSAMGLWALAGAYSMQYKTDGYVPDWFVCGWGKDGRKHAAALVSVGLWEFTTRDGAEGWTFHDWGDYQPSAEDIEKERERARERQRSRRQKLADVRDLRDSSVREDRRKP